jgi:hypothetical protein
MKGQWVRARVSDDIKESLLLRRGLMLTLSGWGQLPTEA